MFGLVGRFFKRVGGWFGNSTSVKKVLDQAYGLLSQALPIVEEVARLTPTRGDDEILALIRKWKLKLHVLSYTDDRGRALFLHEIAAAVLKRRFPERSNSVIDLAVQLAYTTWRARQRENAA